MDIIELDLLDGRGVIPVAVAGCIERDRLLDFMKESTEQARRAECYDDLLAALDEMIEAFQHEYGEDCIKPNIIQAHAAYTKATGTVKVYKGDSE